MCDIRYRCSGDAVSRQQPWLAKSSAPASTTNGWPLITALSQNATRMLIKLQPHWGKGFWISLYSLSTHTWPNFASHIKVAQQKGDCVDALASRKHTFVLPRSPQHVKFPGWRPPFNNWPEIRFLWVMGRNLSQCRCLTVAGTWSVNVLLRQHSSRERICTCSLFDKKVWWPK